VDQLLLLGAGLLAGIVGSVASLASLVSYPALLALGLSPVSANVTNTVALMFFGLGSAAGSRPELAGQGRRVLELSALTAAGGAANVVAGIGFAVFGPVRWAAVPALAAGFLAGGWIGPKIVRRRPAAGLRVAIGCCGLALAIRLGFSAY
jgi:uncharacterized membrane protein YfcA